MRDLLISPKMGEGLQLHQCLSANPLIVHVKLAPQICREEVDIAVATIEAAGEAQLPAGLAPHLFHLHSHLPTMCFMPRLALSKFGTRLHGQKGWLQKPEEHFVESETPHQISQQSVQYHRAQ